MKIQEGFLRVKDLVLNYKDDQEDGITGYDGDLNIRPAYQREFVYKDSQRRAVIESIINGLPLSIMYWVDNKDGTYELLDGQQRTISICQYVNGEFSLDYKYFHNLNEEEKNKILNYELMVFICDGTDQEKLEWFQTINIATTQLTPQELRNAVYHGTWLSDAKRYFSKTSCPAYNMAKDYVKGSPIRQDLLETAIKWACIKDGIKDVQEYMAIHQHDNNALDLWNHFTQVMSWVKFIFPTPTKEVKSIDWGKYYHQYKDKQFDTAYIKEKLSELFADEDVTSTKGIYEFLIDGQEKHLSIRTFDKRTKRMVYEKQSGICIKCQKECEIDEMEADHIIPWSKGGKTLIENCQMLCKRCNATKSNS
jgi:hypothetical protein